MVFLDSLKTNQINLPLVGGVSIATVLVVGTVIFFLSRRKKTIGIKF